MKINVTQQDIDNGIQGDCYRCPIAQAMCRLTGMTPDDPIIEVDTGSITIWTDSQTLVWTMGEDGAVFVDSFDHDMPVQPCTIEATAATCSV